MNRVLSASEPFQRLVDLREGLCEVCGKLCGFESVMPADPDAPELVKTRLCWLGWRLEDHLGTVALVVACSDRCALRMASGTEGTEGTESEGSRSREQGPDSKQCFPKRGAVNRAPSFSPGEEGS